MKCSNISSLGEKFPQYALDIKNRKKFPSAFAHHHLFNPWILNFQSSLESWSHPELPQATGANHHLSQPRKGGHVSNFLTPQLANWIHHLEDSWLLDEKSSPVSSQMTSLFSASRDVDVCLHQPEILSNFFRPLSGSPLMTFRWKVCCAKSPPRCHVVSSVSSRWVILLMLQKSGRFPTEMFLKP